MHLIEQKILNKFKKEPLKEITTTEIVRAVFPEKYTNIIRTTNDDHSDKNQFMKAKREKGQLHRKVLYHLNKLVSEEVLRVADITGKGEKNFTLNIEQGEIIVEKKHKKITLTKPFVSTNLIDEYESMRIVHKYDPDTWINKLNCIILESHLQEGINKYYDIIYNSFSEINDSIGLNNFEHTIDHNTFEKVEEFLNKLDIDTKDHDRYVSIIINVKNIEDPDKIISFIQVFAKKNPQNINIIFKTESKELRSQSRIFDYAIKEFSEHEVKFNIQNRKIHQPPIIMGKAGMYTLNEDEWKDYGENIRGKIKGLVLSQTTVAIDLYRFFRANLGVKEFRELIMKIAKTILDINSTQRKKSNEYFKNLTEHNKPFTKKFFIYAKNYIRFWNYNLLDQQQSHLPELLESAKEEVNNFCNTEEIIFKACGIPITFKILFSTTMRKYSPKLSDRIYKKSTIRKFKDFHSKEISDMVEGKERMSKVFNGGDRTRFFRRGIFTSEEVIKEFVFLMNTYELPLITYDFKELKGEIKLTNFME